MHLEARVGTLTEPLGGRAWEPAETARQVAMRARRYRDGGLERGGRVFLHLNNRLELFAELLAVWEAGGCAVPVDGRLTRFEVQRLAATATPSFSVVDGNTAPEIVEALPGWGIRPLASEADLPEAGAPEPGRSRLDDEALILFTSGSTGSPKGVVHTHRSLLARWQTLRQSLGLEAYRRTLCLLPTHFGHGLICNCLFPWLSGRDLFVLPPFQPDLVGRLGTVIDENNITFLSSVPSTWRLALKLARRPSKGTLRRVHIGSAPLSAHLWEQVRTWAGTKEVFNAYGITETGSWVAGTTLGEFTPEDGLVGLPWGAEIAIRSTAEPESVWDPGAACAPETPGYVWLRTPALMKGYFGRDDLTEQVVSHGWFLTGDIGLLDSRGRLYLKGREREEINKGGMKVHPADVDAVVERFGKARDVCTFGYEDRLFGQNVGMAVVLESTDDDTVRGLHRWLGEHLAEHKVPVRWYVLDEIPRTSRGKVNRAQVEECCRDLTPLDLAPILSGGK